MHFWHKQLIRLSLSNAMPIPDINMVINPNEVGTEGISDTYSYSSFSQFSTISGATVSDSKSSLLL